MTTLTITIDTDRWAVVPKVPTVTNETKAKFIGEYSWKEDAPQFDEEGNLVEIEAIHTVPWDLCKKIFKEMTAHWIAAAPRHEPVQQPEPAFWVRRHPDGRLTNEVLSDSVIEQVRKDSGAWIPLFTEQQPAPRPVPTSERLPFAISADEMEAFDRFRETCEDDQDYDVPVVMMKRLAEIGLVRRVTRNIYETTAFGMAVASGRINIRDYQQGKSDGVAEMAAELKRLCKDFSDRQNRPYMADVHAAIDGLTEQLLEHAEPPAPGEVG